MHDHYTYDYAIIRVVPKVEREEFVNVGVIVSCPARGFLEARIELDEQRLMALDSTLDVESIRAHLATIPAVCAGGEQAGPIGQLSQRERFHWLVAPEAPSFRHRLCTPVVARTRLPCWSTCLTRWCDRLARQLLRRRLGWREHWEIGNKLKR